MSLARGDMSRPKKSLQFFESQNIMNIRDSGGERYYGKSSLGQEHDCVKQ